MKNLDPFLMLDDFSGNRNRNRYLIVLFFFVIDEFVFSCLFLLLLILSFCFLLLFDFLQLVRRLDSPIILTEVTFFELNFRC